MQQQKTYSQQVNILTYVLEDDADIIELLDQLFKMNGFVDYVFFKESEKFVLDLNERVHICVIDYSLGGKMNGIDILKIVLSQNPWCKVIMVTGIVNPRVVIDFVNNGGFRFIPKNDPEFNNSLVTYMQEAIAIVKMQLDTHQELKNFYEELKLRKEKKSMPSETKSYRTDS